jgi:thiosulfate reductase cytochrome b subunit
MARVAKGERRFAVDLIDRRGRPRRATFEHPATIRLAHWAIAIALPILALSGLGIFRAFPSFGPKIPQRNLFEVPLGATLGGWLAGAIQWHFTFAWVFLGAGAVYAVYQAATGNWRQVVVSRSDLAGILPMVRHYLLRAPKPAHPGAYNPLQKLAYTATLAAGALAALSGLALWRPVQLSWLVALMGGFQGVRIAHFVAMCGLVVFIPGHLVMVARAGWNNFRSMWTGFELSAAAASLPSDQKEKRP